MFAEALLVTCLTEGHGYHLRAAQMGFAVEAFAPDVVTSKIHMDDPQRAKAVADVAAGHAVPVGQLLLLRVPLLLLDMLLLLSMLLPFLRGRQLLA